ncbi:hypothetical protein H7992_14375 [Sporosarcina sp. resist]|uniref:hypothetical protein n=1 Tax=Sporosarcina sp. resist TaxID=2762563 RepID=UPI00164E94AE|nr:hypothetical protein [Sporosarcina sp. resist]QNK86445.1 hypothetical protein H7992_14375 [Sporosarcina sp. resist]
MKDRIYVKEVVIGVLILIIFSLILKLMSLEVSLLPLWLSEDKFFGIFDEDSTMSLIGSFVGTLTAGVVTGIIALYIFHGQSKLEIRKVRFIEAQEYLKIIERIWREIGYMNQEIKRELNVNEIENSTLERIKKLSNTTLEVLNKIDERYIPQNVYADFWILRNSTNDIYNSIDCYLENDYFLDVDTPIDVYEGIEIILMLNETIENCYETMNKLSRMYYKEIEKSKLVIK